MFEILEVASRADLKSDLLQELDRQRTFLEALRSNPAISEEKLNGVLSEIESAFAEPARHLGQDRPERCARTNGSWRSSSARASPAARASSTCPRTTTGCTTRRAAGAPTSRRG